VTTRRPGTIASSIGVMREMARALPRTIGTTPARSRQCGYHSPMNPASTAVASGSLMIV
jgi:hypothetical protein